MQPRADDSGYPSLMNKIIVEIPSLPIANSVDGVDQLEIELR